MLMTRKLLCYSESTNEVRSVSICPFVNYLIQYEGIIVFEIIMNALSICLSYYVYKLHCNPAIKI